MQKKMKNLLQENKWNNLMTFCSQLRGKKGKQFIRRHKIVKNRRNDY